jgi:hypothetical protein
LEFTDVAGDDLRIQPHGIHSGKHGLVYRAADRVEQLIERVSRVRLRRVGPEEEEQLIAAAALIAGSRKHGEQRQSVTLVTVLAEKSVILGASECQRPERPKTIAMCRVRIRGRVSHEANLGRDQQDGKKRASLNGGSRSLRASYPSS